MRACDTCSNDTENKRSCAALNTRVAENCFAWADEKMVNKQFSDMINYMPFEDQRERVRKEKEKLKKRLARKQLCEKC